VNQVININITEALSQFISKLPKMRQEAFNRYLIGNTYKEIAYDLNINYETVKTHIRLTKLSLKSQYPEEYNLFIQTEKRDKNRICLICGKHFIALINSRKYCSTKCSNQINKAKNRKIIYCKMLGCRSRQHAKQLCKKHYKKYLKGELNA